LLPISGSFLIAAGLAHLIRKFHDLSTNFALVLGCVLFSLLAVFIARQTRPTAGTLLLWSFFPLIFFGFWYFFVVEFGFFNWPSILFHFFAGLDQSEAVYDYIGKAWQTALGFVIIGFGLLIVKNTSLIFQNTEKWLAILLLIANPAVVSGVANLVSTDSNDDRLYKLYHSPIAYLPDGTEPKNYVHIFLESTERTFFDKAVFGSTMEPLEEIERLSFTATNLRQVENTGWSVAGMTAAYCGVPLSPIGIISRNSFGRTDLFMKNAVCLGDILAPHGYDLSYVVGADPDFAGISKLYSQHGFGQIIGFDDLVAEFADEARTKVIHPSPKWGSHDDVVLKMGMSLLKNKVRAGKPFGIVLETIGGHNPVGNIAPSCNSRQEVYEVEIDILQAIKCTNLLVQDFVIEAEKQGLLENTIVIVQSDHLSMKSKVYDKLQKMERRNLFFIYDTTTAPIEYSKAASSMDIYPTLIEALGFQLNSHKAGVGISMMSPVSTLTTSIGQNKFDDIIWKDSKLAIHLWTDPDIAPE